MNERLQRENAELRTALAATEALSEQRRMLIIELEAKVEDLIQLAAKQSQQISELQQMLRRRMNARKKGRDEGPISVPLEGERPRFR
jgi:predicted ATP-grasp superfamily ATP-dependent carboligase